MGLYVYQSACEPAATPNPATRRAAPSPTWPQRMRRSPKLTARAHDSSAPHCGQWACGDCTSMPVSL